LETKTGESRVADPEKIRIQLSYWYASGSAFRICIQNTELDPDPVIKFPSNFVSKKYEKTS
jgi:hypothetical protein